MAPATLGQLLVTSLAGPGEAGAYRASHALPALTLLTLPAPALCPAPAHPAAPWRRSMRSALLARLSCTRPWLVATQRCCACCASGAALPACAGRQPPRALQASRPSTWSRCSGTQASFRLCLVSGRKLLPRLLEGRVLAAGRLYAYEGSGGGGSTPCSTAKEGREQARALPCPGQL